MLANPAAGFGGQTVMSVRFAVIFVFTSCLLLPGGARAQTSASFKLEEHAFNGGGHPANGANPASTGLRVTLGAIGDSVGAAVFSSASFRLQGNFVSAYPPPGEVANLRIAANKQSLSWSGEASSGTYNLYRDTLGTLAGLGYGSCFQQSINGAGADDTGLPSLGAGFFYLVTVDNRLGEEGTKGSDGVGTKRAGTQCP